MWIVESYEEHQFVGNQYCHPFVGDTGDGRLMLRVICPVVTMVVAVAYVEIQVPAMVAATDQKHLALGFDDVALMMNEEKMEASLKVVMIEEETLKSFGEEDVL